MQKNTISFLITKEEANLLERIIYLEPGIDEVLDNAKEENGLVRLKMDYEDLNECLEALSYEAQQHDSPGENLMALHSKIQGYDKLKELMSAHGKVKKVVKRQEKVFVFDVQIIDPPKGKKVARTIAMPAKKSLYQFAGAIVRSFNFFFDHCFAFYSDVNARSSSKEIYELFVDIGEEPTAPHARGVKNIKVEKAFTEIGKTMLFLFDYGDNWHFAVELKKVRDRVEGEKLPAVEKMIGKAPLQYAPMKDL